MKQTAWTFWVSVIVLALECENLLAQSAASGAEPAPRAYATVVSGDAKTRTGLFAVHRIGARLLFEIPQSELGKDQLLVTEIAQTVSGAGYGGQPVRTRVYRWERRGNRAYLRSVSYDATADSARPEYRAMRDANVSPVVAAFNIEAYGADSALVIDVSRLFTQPPPELAPGPRIPGTVDPARSWVESATPFPDNVNVYATLTLAQNVTPASRGGAVATNPANTVVMSWSFHRLPGVPMMPRYCDDRVGYFEARTTDYTDAYQRVRSRCFIRRYRLEKKDPGAALSEPVKPIVFYLDPATPSKWVPYFKRAIESWQPAFEAAGFKNAIVAREAPDDPDWSPEDARYSVVRWLPSALEDASGPHIFDPRSGEVLSAHIQFYENAQKFLYSLYFLQASAVDPRARVYPLPDSLMGRLLEYMLAHEVGHTLGFGHNMKASSTYPTDSLRSADFLRQWGHSPSIMDYSRFNYLVQPEDSIPAALLMPTIGPYDIWATKWGYTPLVVKTPDEERPTLDAWAREQDTKPHLRFSTDGTADSDPGEEPEAVGDADAVKATGWGLKNIKREVAYLMQATGAPFESTEFLNELYGRLMLQWRWELIHVTHIVGGAESQEKYGTQPGVRFVPVSKARQRAAVKFLNENAFTTPSFFLDEAILRRIEPSGAVARVLSGQNSILTSLLDPARLVRMSEYAEFAGPDGYSIGELLSELRHGLFSELARKGRVDVYRRALQRAFVENLSQKLNAPSTASSNGTGTGTGDGRPVAPPLDPAFSDLHSAVRAELRALDTGLESAGAVSRDEATKAHLADLRHRIAFALHAKDEPSRGLR